MSNLNDDRAYKAMLKKEVNLEKKLRDEMISITAIHLFRTGDHVIVAVEIDDHWITVIHERYDANFSHIVEPSGIRAARQQQAREALGQKEEKDG